MNETSFLNETDFTLESPVNLQNDYVYGKGKESDIPDENLFSSTNKMSKRVMISAVVSWYGVTKPFFVNNNGIKVTKKPIANICLRSCFLLLKKLLNVMIGYFIKIDRHLLDSTWYKILLKQSWNVVTSVPKIGLHLYLM